MANKKNHAGRPGSTEVTRNLLNLASSLSDPGDFVSIEAIMKRLGCSLAQAEKLYALLTNLSANPGGIAAYEDDEGLVMGTGNSRGRALRLDGRETIALVSALQQLGIGKDHPLRAKLQGSLAAGDVDESLISRMVAAKPDDKDAKKIAACAEAIAGMRGLVFEYRKPGAAPKLRRVRPERLSQEDGSLYLHGLDLHECAGRTFRLDRMDRVTDVARDPDESPNSIKQNTETQRVKVTFLDDRFRSLFSWPGLELDANADGQGNVTGTLPYYESMWLPRQIAACGGAVTVDDAEVSALVQSYAQELLSSIE